jgi:hypothetical protein
MKYKILIIQSFVIIGTLCLSMMTHSCSNTKFLNQQEAVQNGRGLEKIREIDLDSFVGMWSLNKVNYKFNFNIQQLTKDNQYTYFTKPYAGFLNPKNKFFKVSNTSIEQFPNFQEIYPEVLRDYVWKELIPKEEKYLWDEYSTREAHLVKAECSFYKNKIVYDYSLKDKEMTVTATWNFRCRELRDLDGKFYKAVYDLENKSFVENH